jgi:hypothetical protein
MTIGHIIGFGALVAVVVAVVAFQLYAGRVLAAIANCPRVVLALKIVVYPMAYAAAVLILIGSFGSIVLIILRLLGFPVQQWF